MPFSTNQITLASEADTLLQMAQRDKRNLEYRREGISIRSENSAETAVEQAAELTEAQQDLEQTITALATLPPGEYRDTQEIKKMELELKIKKLTRTGSKGSAVSLLEMEYDSHLYDQRLAGIAGFMTAVNDRKAQL